MNDRALVIGAGVSGLTCALRLLQRGLAVRIWTAEPPQQSTSSVAAAFWYPYLVEPLDRVAGWSDWSLREFTRLADVPESGVRFRPATVLYNQLEEDPVWRQSTLDLEPIPNASLPVGVAAGYTLRLPVIDMPVYLQWLQDQIEALGVNIEIKRLESLAPALAAERLVINCTALGSRELVNDRQLYPVRGQVVSVQCPRVERLIFRITHDERPSYIVPRTRDCILGGTSEQSDSRAVDPATSAAIRQRCTELEPQLADAVVLAEKVGLRPCRHEVRLEAEAISPTHTVIHNYGHGGAGVTLSWGCAEEVVELATGEK